MAANGKRKNGVKELMKATMNTVRSLEDQTHTGGGRGGRNAADIWGGLSKGSGQKA